MKKFLNKIILMLLCISFVSSSSFSLAVEGETANVAETTSVASVLNEKHDINGDGAVSMIDAELVLKIAAGQKPADEKADVNGDGVISTEDVKLILNDINAPMSDSAYIIHLLDLGFKKSYVEELLALYRKYPNWQFVPFVTNLDWADVVYGERSEKSGNTRKDKHNKQLIENNVSQNFMCDCSACKGVIQEGSNWVSASEEAVAYYLDPRNFLTEEYIFQFETTAYNSEHTINAVESILKPTWMYNSDITYLDASGKEQIYKQNDKPVKYSEAIMQAAKDSGMSAYYLASKIVQEVGSSTSSYAAGSSGKSSPYNGIYNYYNIGAYTGAGDGLRWANGYMKAKSDAKLYKTATTAAEVIATVSKGTELNFIEKNGNFYNVKVKVNEKYYTGFIHKDYVSIADEYGRPWNNPYKTIYYGAQYIYESFSETQFTGYLQKFNVNPASDNLYSHEYMANVRAAAAESKKNYKAYRDNNLLNDTMVFYIPVFNNMPNGDFTREEAFKATVPKVEATATRTSVTLSWSSIKDAYKYQIWKYNDVDKKYERISNVADTVFTDTGLAPGDSLKYRVRAFYSVEGGYMYTQYSPVITINTISGIVEQIGEVKVSDILNIREAPNTESNIVIKVKNGQAVKILSTEGIWHKVELTVDGKKYTGYAHSDYIVKKLTFGGKEYTEPTATLRSGSTGDDVIWLQMYLTHLGYMKNDQITGVYDATTLAAVKKFQEDKQLDVDGIAGKDTRTALKKATE